jgi:phytoene dehydrogenase-like protein
MFETNGVEPDGDADDVATSAIRKQLASYTARIDELRTELATLTVAAKRYERALALLTGEPPAQRTQAKASGTTPKKMTVNPERTAEIERLIRDYAQEHDEFRQVDIRSLATGTNAKSSVMSIVFENLRQTGVIRLARQDGNHKFFRLTREALREQS